MEYTCLNGVKCRNLEPIKVNPLTESVAICPECQHKNRPIEYLFRCVGFWMPSELNDQADEQKKTDVIEVLNWICFTGVRQRRLQRPKQREFKFADVSAILSQRYKNSDLRSTITSWVATKHFGYALREAGYDIHEEGFRLKDN